MTFEERMDRLAARHEGLTQTVELMLHQQEDLQRKHELRFEEMERQYQKTQAQIDKTQAQIDKTQAQMNKTQVFLAQVVESIDALSRVAHLHEKRISDLEDGSS